MATTDPGNPLVTIMNTSPSVVEVSGELDLSTVARWEANVETVGRGGAAVVLDLSHVRFVDSAGVRMLFRLARALAERGVQLIIVAPPGSSVRRLLGILDIEEMTPVCASVAQARWLVNVREPARGRLSNDI